MQIQGARTEVHKGGGRNNQRASVRVGRDSTTASAGQGGGGGGGGGEEGGGSRPDGAVPLSAPSPSTRLPSADGSSPASAGWSTRTTVSNLTITGLHTFTSFPKSSKTVSQ